MYGNGVSPRLNTSMYWFGCDWYGLNAGSTAASLEAGQVEVEPSTATPISAAVGGLIRLTAGKMTSGRATLLSSGCCHGALGP